MITITGSLAYDYLMNFNGDLTKSLVKTNKNLSVSYFAKTLAKHYGGTAGNIAYSLALLGEKFHLVSTMGKDYPDYFAHFKKNGIETKNISIVKNDITASAYILTDNFNNQLTSFYGGAMLKSNEKKISEIKKKSTLSIIAATELNTMIRHLDNSLKNKIPYILDLGQSMPLWTKEPLLKYVSASFITIVNEYELTLVAKVLGVTEKKVSSLCKNLIVTLGEHGSKIISGAKEINIPIYKIKKCIDPTGCGDAYRSGLLYGLANNLDLEKSCKIGAIISSFVIEKKGTQEHSFTKKDIEKRYKEAFKEKL